MHCPDECKRKDKAGRSRACYNWEGGRCIHGHRPRVDCTDFGQRPPRHRDHRSPGRKPIEPNPPRTPDERVARWGSLLVAFEQYTGIAVGIPPSELCGVANPEVLDLQHGDVLIPGLGAPVAWPGRDPALLDVLRSKAFDNACQKLPPRGGFDPSYEERKAAVEAWKALRDAARRVAEWPAETEARHRAREGLSDWRPGDADARARQASAWLDLPSKLTEAAHTLADAEIPEVKVPTGRPREGWADALAALVPVLATVKRSDHNPLTDVELTWLVMLACPTRFLYRDEMKLRDLVGKARRPVVRKKPPRA